MMRFLFISFFLWAFAFHGASPAFQTDADSFSGSPNSNAESVRSGNSETQRSVSSTQVDFNRAPAQEKLEDSGGSIVDLPRTYFGEGSKTIEAEKEVDSETDPAFYAEPAIMLLFGSGMILLAGFGRKKLLQRERTVHRSV